MPIIPMDETQPRPKYKVGDVVKLKPYIGDIDTIENINLLSWEYNSVRDRNKLTITMVHNSTSAGYGWVYGIHNGYVFHESRIELVKKVIRY